MNILHKVLVLLEYSFQNLCIILPDKMPFILCYSSVLKANFICCCLNEIGFSHNCFCSAGLEWDGERCYHFHMFSHKKPGVIDSVLWQMMCSPSLILLSLSSDSVFCKTGKVQLSLI